MFSEISVLRNRKRALSRISLCDDLYKVSFDECIDYLKTTELKPLSILVQGYVPEMDELSEQYPDASIYHDLFAESIFEPDQSFDLVLSFGTLHWTNDPVQHVKNLREHMSAGAHFYSIFPGGDSLLEFRKTLAQAEKIVSGGVSQRVMPMIESKDGLIFLQEAGFRAPISHTTSFELLYNSIYDLMMDLRYTGNANALDARSNTFAPKRLFETANDLYPKDGSVISVTVDLVTLIGRT
jgi:SAM-dependent methyltransferase